MKWIINWQIVHGKVQKSLVVLFSFWSLWLGMSYAAQADGVVGFDAIEIEQAAVTPQVIQQPLIKQPQGQLSRPNSASLTPPSPTLSVSQPPANPSQNPSSPADAEAEVVVFPAESRAAIAPTDSSVAQGEPEVDRTVDRMVDRTVDRTVETTPRNFDRPSPSLGSPSTSHGNVDQIGNHNAFDNADTTIFAGGANSLVARAVGSAEGTRRPDGGKNPAYYGHVDPGNAQWNLGSFSYQHGAASPAEADDRQLRRLQKQDQMIRERAAQYGMQLGLKERLNAIDLANQAPLAALDRGGYVERLKAAKQAGLSGEAAILEARVNAYRHPDTQQWDAPGLGNNEAFIRHDQARRMDAIAQAMMVDQTWIRKRGQFQRVPRSSGTEVAQVMQMDQTWTR
ncbi:hypothetical protein [Alkalinema sp. FACHB-956]|uniref:hypothetical protein n=1 Tax=Alkalinema sp. FACHB-956 TaxID=2692768 RepID=UPI001682F829|nr:hypothetical protein [Alkalinema sp. FACHB-956]MBD2327725.1 hypothetical protein [Alkalinema sp. FACHB-956]